MRTLLLSLACGGSLGIVPTSALAQCSSYCAVGGAGTGGLNSGGQAQGFHYIAPGDFAGNTATNSGNINAGRLVIDQNGNVIGTLTGTYRDGICRGTQTGIFGDSHGYNPTCF